MCSISIVMATYNGMMFLSEQLESLRRQTVLPNELVIVDDCSTDETLTIVAGFAATAPFPVRVEKNRQNIGYRASFMKAASLCGGDLIAFCDQDDVWLPEKLATCSAAFDNEDVLLAFHGAKVVDQNLNYICSLDRKSLVTEINPPQTIDPIFFALGFTIIFHRCLLQFNDEWHQSVDWYMPNEREGHDEWFFFLASALGTIVYIREPMALYRRHNKNISEERYGNSKFDEVVEKMRNLFAPNIGFIEGREMCVERRKQFIRNGGDKIGYSYRHLAESACIGYKKIEFTCRWRRKMYQSINPFFRIYVILKLLLLGCYADKNKKWGAGKTALTRDIIRGLIVPFYYKPKNSESL